MKLYKRVLTDHWGRREENFEWRTYQVPLDVATIDRVCILHLNDKLGDAIVNSPLVAALAGAKPDLAIDVLTTESYREYWNAHPAVTQVIVAPPKRRGRFRTLFRARELQAMAKPWRGRFDCVVSYDSYAFPEHFAMLRTLAPKVLIGFNKHAYRLFDYSLEEGRHGIHLNHVATRAATVMRVFGIELDMSALRFHTPFGPEDEAKAEAIVARLPSSRPRMLFHVYGAGKEKRMTPATAVEAVRVLREAGQDGPLFVSVPPGTKRDYQDALCARGIDDDIKVIEPVESYFVLSALVAKMDAVVAVDTALGHIAAALGKPQVCVFSRQVNVPTTWKPYNPRCAVVVSTTGDTVNDLDWGEFAAATKAALQANVSDRLVRQR